MSSAKRKSIDSQLHRRVRARRELSEELEDVAALSESSSAVDDDKEVSDDESLNEQDEESSGGSESDSSSPEPSGEEEDEDEDEEPLTAESISFGALAKAQASLNRKGSKNASTTSKTTRKGKDNDETWTNNEAIERKAGHKDHRDFSRTNKHAPTEQSSKKAVSRRREVIAINKPVARDPRFESTSNSHPPNPTQIKKAYSFLDTYRASEMAELRQGIKAATKAGDMEAVEKLKGALRVMESREKTRERKEREEEVLARWKKEEKEKVREGKKPFYLKRGEVRKRVLVEEFKGLKGNKVEKVIERRRKKLASREMKRLPMDRRMGGE